MRSATLIALLILAVLAVGPCSAQAQEPADDPQVASWLGAARSYFQRSPDCPAGVAVVRAEWIPGDPTIWGASVPGGCTIALDPDFYPRPATVVAPFWNAAMCSVVVHEWGHLLGLGHSLDPASVMHATAPPNVVPGCPFYRPPGRLVQLHRKRERARASRGLKLDGPGRVRR